ncbi:MAG TPA: type IV secretion system protein [Steroidobacteraceae bacterium]|nr:type IV secretion system protein [Steroidobacteraceae bacterium]
MGFFETFWTWLNGELASYIGENTARVASILEPAVITLGTVYVMIWGYLQLTGRIEEPFVAGVKRIVTLAVILGMALHLWLYNSLLVDTFYNAPTEFAAAVVGASDPVQTIDAIWNAGGAVADQLFRDGGYYSGLGYTLAGLTVWLIVGLLCVYTMFLLALSSVALAVLLALGPLFVSFLLFDTTRRFFEAWLAQLANYALITILTVMVAALMLHLVQSYAQQTQALGTAIRTVDALNMVLATVLVFLFVRQVMPIAAGLAGGVALNSLGAVSRTIRAPMRAVMTGLAIGNHVRNLRSSRHGQAKQQAAPTNSAGISGGAS